MKRLMEVRCCCDPDKLLGWLEVPPSCKRFIDIPVWSRDGKTLLQMEVAVIQFGIGIKYEAIKANHTAIETLRLAQGFIEADHDND